MRAALFVGAAVAAALLFSIAPACDLFGVISCSKDADCPDNLQFCESGTCSATASDGRHGRGVGEGEGEGEGGTACSGDGDCASVSGLCYDKSDDTGLFGQCVPTADDDTSCAETSGLGGISGTSGGPLIFKGSAFFQTGDCPSGAQNVGIDVHFLTRNSPLSESGVEGFVIDGTGSGPTLTGPGSMVTSDGLSGDILLFDHACVPDTQDHVAFKIGDSSPESNVLCIPITGAP